jgi:hypothetical protein
LRLDDVPDVPALDEAESRWSDLQRHRLSAALLSLSSEDRQVCDRRWFRVGLGCGLERIAMLRYGIDDVRKVESACAF